MWEQFTEIYEKQTQASPLGKKQGNHSASVVREVFETGKFIQSITKPLNQQIVALSLSMWVTLTLSALLTSLGHAGPEGRGLRPKVAEEAGEQGPGDWALGPAVC